MIDEFLFLFQRWALAALFVGGIVVLALLLAGWRMRS